MTVYDLGAALQYFAAVTGACVCVGDALADNTVIGTLGRPGRVICLVPGAEAAWDGCECGQLAFAFSHGPYPSRNFPAESAEDTSSQGCQISATGVRVVLSLSRCEYHPPMFDDGRPPTESQQLNAAILQQIESFVMRQALTCCLAEQKRSLLIDDFRIGSTDYLVNGDCGQVSIVFWLGIV